MTDAKVKINVKEGVIELEGSEGFVKEYLNEFKVLLTQSRAELPAIQSQSDTAQIKNTEVSKPKLSKKTAAKKKSAPTVVSERFEIHGDGQKQSLEAFLNEKNPGKANGEKIVCIGFYITEILKIPVFTEGNIEYAYKMLKYSRPNHLHQIMLNTKSENDWFEQDSEISTSWKLTRSGEIFVSESLPKKTDK